MKEGPESKSPAEDRWKIKAPVISPRPLTEVSKDEWECICVLLRAYTKARFDYVRNYGLTPDDIAHQAIADTLEGRRRWPVIDPITGAAKGDVDLFTFLCECTRSLVSHVMRKGTRTVSLTDLGAHSGANGSVSNERAGPDQLPRSGAGESPESKIEYDDFSSVLREAAKGDTRLEAMVELLIARPGIRPGELAEALGLNPKKARYLKKVLKRKLLRSRYGKKG
jgi:hypothetical protein